MKQKVSVYACIKQGGKVLLLKRAQGNEALIGKFELPGGPLPATQSPYSAMVEYLRDQLGVEPTTVQLQDVRGYTSVYNDQIQRIEILYLAALEGSVINLSPRHSKYIWKYMQELQQNDVTEATYNLLSMDTFEKIPKLVDSKKWSEGDDKKATELAIIYCDGGSRGNPGPSASGFVILDAQQQMIEEGGAYLGITTNNQAEYHAVRLALEAALRHNIKHIQFRLDSMLVVNQMLGIYKIKSRDLWPIHERIKELMHHFKEVKFTHVRREFNKDADAMVNKILDEHAST